MSHSNEIKRALVNMIAEVTCGESIHGPGFVGKHSVEMFGPYFMVSPSAPFTGHNDKKHYFEIVLSEIDEEKFDITENYQP